MNARSLACVALLAACAHSDQASAQIPDAIAAPGQLIATLHAEGAQIYECKADSSSGKLTWQFREPIATLLVAGKTVGRHYAGPNWEHIDGSAVTAKAAANVPAQSPKDIPWLRLDVTGQRGGGILTAATTVQRVNTQGGGLEGACDRAGTYQSVPYSADYLFVRKGG